MSAFISPAGVAITLPPKSVSIEGNSLSYIIRLDQAVASGPINNQPLLRRLRVHCPGPLPSCLAKAPPRAGPFAAPCVFVNETAGITIHLDASYVITGDPQLPLVLEVANFNQPAKVFAGGYIRVYRNLMCNQMDLSQRLAGRPRVCA